MQIPTRTRRWFLAVAAGVAIALVATPAAADPQDDKARVERELEQAKAALEASSERVEAATAAYLEANARLPEVQKRLADARLVLAAAKSKADSATAKAEKAAADLAAADRVLAAAVDELKLTQEQVEAIAASAYMGRDVAGIDAMLAVESPAMFVASLTYLSYVGDVQQEALDRHTAARDKAEQRRREQARLKEAADQAKRVADEAYREAAEAEQKAAKAEREVATLVVQREEALRVAEEEREATEERYRQLQAESERIAEEIRRLAGGGGPVISAGDRLLMPVDGRLTSNFGNRLDPIYNVWRLHAGIDLAAPGGAPIYAAAAGEVFRAGWNGGYGNYTCIYHGARDGKGVATCYAHQSAILVSAGDQVRAGQLIGRVGTTGHSTGNHLHFEVRLDGTPVDPLPWLPPCLC